MTDYSGKTVIVTGGAKGIGEAVTRAFAQAGADVFCADVDTEAGAKMAAESEAAAGSITFVDADVSQASVCQALVHQAAAANGGVDILINNVGIQPLDSYLPAHEFPEETWDRIIAVNLKSGFLMTKYAVPEMMKRGGGVIVNTASVQGRQSMKGVPAYAASKGGHALPHAGSWRSDYAEHKHSRPSPSIPAPSRTPPRRRKAWTEDLEAPPLGKQPRAHPIGPASASRRKIAHCHALPLQATAASFYDRRICPTSTAGPDGQRAPGAE